MSSSPLRILVTAGPTREHLDDVRFLSNASSGRMGYAVARAAIAAGHHVVLVHGPTPLPPPEGPELVPVVSARDMHAAVLSRFADVDAAVLVAAVADYRPETRISGKRRKSDAPWELRLVRNPDIAFDLGRLKDGRTLVGFALEASDGVANARRKLVEKNLDLIVQNAPAAAGADRADFQCLFADGSVKRYMSVTKDFLAQALVSFVEKDRLSRDR